MPDTHFAIPGSIARLGVPTLGQEDASVRDLVGRHRGENWIRSLAVNPDTASRFARYFEHLSRQGGARLPLRERELIAVVVSAQNGCGLCEVHHTNALGDALDDPTRARRIALDHHLAPLIERERALADFAVKVTTNPKDVGTPDLERLRAVGHPTHGVRPVGCWALKDTPLAVPQTSGRQRLNIHGAIDLETGRTRMIEAATVNAISMIMLLRAIEAMHPGKRLIHLFVDNARYHHAKLVQAWLARPGCRVKLHFIPTYCPHLDPAERLWGLMHRHVTHNRCHATFADFKAAILTFLREEVPRKWGIYCDEITDNFRIISAKDFRVLT